MVEGYNALAGTLTDFNRRLLRRIEALDNVEMTYQELCNRFLSAIRKIDTNPRLAQHVNAIISYFRLIAKKSESRAIIRQIKDKVKLVNPQEENENNRTKAESSDGILLEKSNESSDLLVTDPEQSKITGPNPFLSP